MHVCVHTCVCVYTRACVCVCVFSGIICVNGNAVLLWCFAICAGNVINIQTGEWVGKMSGLGAGMDSFYEYLIKVSVGFFGLTLLGSYAALSLSLLASLFSLVCLASSLFHHLLSFSICRCLCFSNLKVILCG